MKTTEVFATNYITPLIKVINLEMEGEVLAGSAAALNESYIQATNYTGTWN